MIAVSRGRLAAWADKFGIPNLILAEQDYRLTWALAGLYASPALKETLALKGGTALNKVYFGKLSRLSVDLDFNLLGPPHEVVKQGATARRAVESVLREQDPAYALKFHYREDQTTVTARYTPVAGGAKQPLKVEMSVRESVPILGLLEKEIPTPEGEAAIKVKTYRLEELLATKIRALYERRKGRDIFDLDRALGMELNMTAVRKMVYYYFYRSGKIFNWNVVKANLEKKAADKGFCDDIRPFLRPDVKFDGPAAVRRVIESFASLSEPDEKDAEFLALAKGLVGRTKSPKKLARTRRVTHPVGELMKPIPITREAAALTVEDIRLGR